MAFTYTDAGTYLRYYNKDDTSTLATAMYLRICNEANREMHSAADLDCDARISRQALVAQYSTGTVSVSASGTTVTGSGTTFTAAMVNRYIRFNNEPQQYLITAYTSATSITIETGGYLGTAALSAVSYRITDECFAMPTRMRSIKRLEVDTVTANINWYLNPCSMDQMYQMRSMGRLVDVPRYYSTEYRNPSSGNVPAGKVWVYPPPQSDRILTLFFSKWPAEITTGTDDFSIPYEYESIIREYLLGHLYRLQGKLPESQTQLARARQILLETCGIRSKDENTQREEWEPPAMQPNYFGWYATLDPNTPLIQ